MTSTIAIRLSVFLPLSCARDFPVQKTIQVRIDNKESRVKELLRVRLSTVRLTPIIKLFLTQRAAFPFCKRVWSKIKAVVVNQKPAPANGVMVMAFY